MSTNVGQFCFPCYIDTCDVVYNGSFLCCHLLYLIIYLQSLVIKEISINMVLVLSQRQFPKDDFPSDNFQGSNFPKIRLGPLRLRRLQWGTSAAARMDWGPSAAVRTDLGSCCLGNCTFGKILWESTNIYNYTIKYINFHCILFILHLTNFFLIL